MGMSTHIVGFRPPDEKFMAFKAIYELCEKSGVTVPDEVEDFFEGEAPDDHGVKVDLDGYTSCVKEWSDEYGSGYELTVPDLPKDVTVVRFYNSW